METVSIVARPAEKAAPVDPAALARLRQLRSREVMILTYLEEAQELLARLGAAVAAEDAAGVKQAAHSLKGSSGYLGAQQVVTLSAALEQKGRGGSTSGAATLLAQLEEEFERVRQVLEVEVNNGHSAR
ncbi:MAG: Hpt domain-containing protein [Chloroflexi bacterium]|nr:Hpt domain-containing protein [Chloroflexota bacterium]